MSNYLPPLPPILLQKNAALLEKASQFQDHQWTQGVYARGIDGQAVDHRSPAAHCLCAMGHLMRAAHNAGLGQGGGFQLYDLVAKELPGDCHISELARWNDELGRRPEEVRQLMRQAAAKLRAAIPAGAPNPTAR